MTFKCGEISPVTDLGGLIVNSVSLADSVSAQTGRDTVRRRRRGPVLPAAGELGGADTSRHAPQDEQAEQPRPLHKRHSTPVSGTGPRLSAVSRHSAFGWRGLLGDENLLGEPSPRAGRVVWPTEGRGFEICCPQFRCYRFAGSAQVLACNGLRICGAQLNGRENGVGLSGIVGQPRTSRPLSRPGRAGSRRTPPSRARGCAAGPGSAGWRSPPPRRQAGRTPVRSPRRGSSVLPPPSPAP
jgi:hypothetical protein